MMMSSDSMCVNFKRYVEVYGTHMNRSILDFGINILIDIKMLLFLAIRFFFIYNGWTKQLNFLLWLPWFLRLLLWQLLSYRCLTIMGFYRGVDLWKSYYLKFRYTLCAYNVKVIKSSWVYSSSMYTLDLHPLICVIWPV